MSINLIKELTISDFKLKYRGSILGFFWSLLKPLMMFTVLYFVFARLINLKIQFYSLFLLLGIVLWNFFSEGTTTGMNSLLAKADLVRKLNLRKEIIVLSSCISSFISLILNMTVFIFLMLILKQIFDWQEIALRWHALFFFVILIEIFILVLGLSFGLSALYSKYRDLSHIWEISLLVGFWATPIVYSFSSIPQQYLKYYILNPMARIIYTSRDIFIFNKIASIKHLIITFIICWVILVIGYYIFKKRYDKFAEEI